jgi:hypothetical protein
MRRGVKRGGRDAAEVMWRRRTNRRIPVAVMQALIAMVTSAPVVACDFADPRAHGPDQRQTVQVPGQETMLRANWMLITTFDDHCQYKIPQSWQTSEDNALAWSADGKLWIAVASVQIASWTLHKAGVKAALRAAKIVDDSERRFWFESDEGLGRRVNYISAFSGSVVCDALMEVHQSPDTSSADVIREIALSVETVPR